MRVESAGDAAHRSEVREVPWDPTHGVPTFRVGDGPLGRGNPEVPLKSPRAIGAFVMATLLTLSVIAAPLWVYWVTRRVPGRKLDVRRPTSIALALLVLGTLDVLPTVAALTWLALLALVLRATNDAVRYPANET